MSTPQDGSWSWRRILECRSVAQQFMGVCIGNGENTNFMYGFWHPNGGVIDWFPQECLNYICLMISCI